MRVGGAPTPPRRLAAVLGLAALVAAGTAAAGAAGAAGGTASSSGNGTGSSSGAAGVPATGPAASAATGVRAAGAGSLAAYCLAITDIDPIPYGLLFERFLNIERVSMPDFD
ncbi:MAG: hypothetical protein LBI49_16490, partial [Nocardiopsaceae bacterium]|nr:hypothetical protein [Nocardiopsaceae bacterium]